VRTLALLLLVAAPLAAQTALPPAHLANRQLPDPRQEAEARALMEEVRCLVCAGQSIADSDADMAGDMRALVRERIAAGESADEVRDWLIDRYGDAVSYNPPWSWRSAPLWIAPLVVLAFGLWLARGLFRRRR
jgi:cytochrome c-type biogenesis protein CcmH